MANKYKVIIIEDDEFNMESIKLEIKKLEGFDEVVEYKSKKDYKENCLDKKVAFDIALLDIELKNEDGSIDKNAGIDIANTMVGKQIIFISSHKEVALDALKIDAVGFCPKPIDSYLFERYMNRAIKMLDLEHPQKEFITFNTDKGKNTVIKIKDIFLIRRNSKDPRDKDVYLQTKEKITIKNEKLDDIYKQLNSNQFHKIGRDTILLHSALDLASFNKSGSSLILKEKYQMCIQSIEKNDEWKLEVSQEAKDMLKRQLR